MRRAMTGIALVIASVCIGIGAPALLHGGMGARAMVAPTRPVVAPYHQESSIRAIHTAPGYRVVAPAPSH